MVHFSAPIVVRLPEAVTSTRPSTAASELDLLQTRPICFMAAHRGARRGYHRGCQETRCAAMVFTSSCFLSRGGGATEFLSERLAPEM